MMEGFLLVPPDRGTIIGRAVWKARYIILGSPIRRQQPQESLTRSASSHRLQAARKGLISSPRPLGDESPLSAPEQSWLSIYKQKDDWEAVAQYQMPTIKSCEIQNIQYKKPGPTVPTLVITFDVDPAAEKTRKRRSSRSAGMSSMNAYPNSILFRTAPDDAFTIYDWQMAIQPLMRSNFNMESPMSPMSPTSPQFNAFTNPFASNGIDNRNLSRPDLPRRGSSNAYSSTGTLPGVQRNHDAQQSALISPSPSLKSRRSDLSSQASSLNRPQGYQTSFPIQHPLDLPSPASTAGYEDQLISGWTSAQGRSSALSSHTRGSNSISVAGTPPAPTQTILDRAFQMRMIPGSERTAEDEASKLSSIARFEALMKETDERIRAGKNSAKATSRASKIRAWDLEEEEEGGEEEDSSDGRRANENDSDELYLEEEEDDDDMDPLAMSVHEIPPPAQRALEYIAGRTLTPSQRPTSGRSMPGPLRSPSPAFTSSAQPPPLPRSISTDATTFNNQHQQNSRTSLSKRKSRPVSMALPSTTSFDELTPTSTNLKRRSSQSTKRLSFGEFAKRLSSGSSLLLVQTNQSDTSSSTSRRSSENSVDYIEDDSDFNGQVALHRGLSASRLSGMSSSGVGMKSGGGQQMNNIEPNGEKCGWRGSGFGTGSFGATEY